MSLNYFLYTPTAMNYTLIHNKVRQLLSSLTNISQQGKYYDLQKKGIADLKNSEWYKYIIEYLQMEIENATQKLYDVNTSKESLPYYQWQCHTAITLLDFLNNV